MTAHHDTRVYFSDHQTVSFDGGMGTLVFPLRDDEDILQMQTFISFVVVETNRRSFVVKPARFGGYRIAGWPQLVVRVVNWLRQRRAR